MDVIFSRYIIPLVYILRYKDRFFQFVKDYKNDSIDLEMMRLKYKYYDINNDYNFLKKLYDQVDENIEKNRRRDRIRFFGPKNIDDIFFCIEEEKKERIVSILHDVFSKINK